MDTNRRERFKKLFLAHYSRLCGVAYGFVADGEDAEDIVQELTAHHFIVGFQRQKKGGQPDGDSGQQGQLQRLERIRQRQADGHQTEQQRENILDQKQRRRALDVIDDPPPFGHHVG